MCMPVLRDISSGLQVHRHTAAAHQQPHAAGHEPAPTSPHKGTAAQAAGQHTWPGFAHNIHYRYADLGTAFSGNEPIQLNITLLAL